MKIPALILSAAGVLITAAIIGAWTFIFNANADIASEKASREALSARVDMHKESTNKDILAAIELMKDWVKNNEKDHDEIKDMLKEMRRERRNRNGGNND